jgi:hypothetical protein
MTDARFGGLARETLDATTGTVRVAGLAREVLLGGKTTPSFAGLVREVLRTPEGPSTPQLRPWLRHDQFRDGDDAEEWSPFRRRLATVAVPGGLRRPWLRQHFALEELDEEAWRPPRYGIAPAIIAPQPLPWLRRPFAEELDQDMWRPPLRGTPAAIIAPQQKPWPRQHFSLDEDDDSAPLMAVLRHRGLAPPSPPPVVTSLSETLFIANVGRLMGRRG